MVIHHKSLLSGSIIALSGPGSCPHIKCQESEKCNKVGGGRSLLRPMPEGKGRRAPEDGRIALWITASGP